MAFGKREDDEALADGSQEANEEPEAEGSANDDGAQDDDQGERPDWRNNCQIEPMAGRRAD